MMYKFSQNIEAKDVVAIEEFLEKKQLTNWCIDHDADTKQNNLIGFFDDKESGIDNANTLKANLTINREFNVSEVVNADWENEYKKHLKPWSSLELHWVPVWVKDTYSVPAGHHVVFLDAGMAFGTGSHETTRMCAQSIVMFKKLYEKNNDFILKSFIDVGCGSGILAISAQKLGFVDVYGFDIDNDAVRVSNENSLNNGLAESDIEFVTADINNGLIGRQADFVAANILANVLVCHIDMLINSVKDGGMLCLSGILLTEAEDIKVKFDEKIKHCWKDNISQILHDGEWAAITYFRNEK